MYQKKGTQLRNISRHEVLHFQNANLKKGRESKHKKHFTAKFWIPDIAFTDF